MKPEKWEELQACHVVICIVARAPMKNTWATHGALQGGIERKVPVLLLIQEGADEAFGVPNPLPDNVVLQHWVDGPDMAKRIGAVMDSFHKNMGTDEVKFVGDYHETYIHKDKVQ